jgi:hypothetical protein
MGFCLRTDMAKLIRWQRQRWRNKCTKRRHGEVNMQIFNLSLRKHVSDSCSIHSTYFLTVLYPSPTQMTLLLSQLMYSLIVKSLSWALKTLFFYYFLSVLQTNIYLVTWQPNFWTPYIQNASDFSQSVQSKDETAFSNKQKTSLFKILHAHHSWRPLLT